MAVGRAIRAAPQLPLSAYKSILLTTIMFLFPILKEATMIKQYRPICLLNVSFKIITKALILKVEKCLGRIIDPCQTAFLKKRNIMDGVLCLHEVLNDIKARKKDGIIYLSLTLKTPMTR